MRLSDHLMLERGTERDIGGIVTKTCAAILEAERFELTDDVARACYNLTRSRPTSLLAAMPLVRAGFRKLWIEWRGGIVSEMDMTKNRRDQEWAPDPIKQGCLVETDANGQLGTMTFAWLHKGKPELSGEALYTPVNIAPLGILFNWKEDANVHDDAQRIFLEQHTLDEITPEFALERILLTRYLRPKSDDELRNHMERSSFHNWGKLAHKPQERYALKEIEKHAMPFVSPKVRGFFKWCAEMAMESQRGMETFLNDIVSLSWEPDIEGEGPFIETVIAMMNSRNAVEHRPVDLKALNKSRAKRGRPTFLSYRTTHLRLSQAHTRAFRAGLMSREEAGEHTVTGHFKVRKTGVYWWSEFKRGDPARPITRKEYKVEA